MNILSVLALSIAATLDSFVIGLGFGLKGVRISVISNLYISLVCFGGTAAAMLPGSYLSSVLPPGMAGGLGGLVLLGLGLWMLIGALRRREGSLHGVCTDPDRVDKNNSKRVELLESMGIGLVLALNNVGLGIGAGISGLPVLATSLLCAAASFVFTGAGCALGGRIVSGRLSKILEIASGLLVVGLGVSSLL